MILLFINVKICNVCKTKQFETLIRNFNFLFLTTKILRKHVNFKRINCSKVSLKYIILLPYVIHIIFTNIYKVKCFLLILILMVNFPKLSPIICQSTLKLVFCQQKKKKNIEQNIHTEKVFM